MIFFPGLRLSYRLNYRRLKAEGLGKGYKRRKAAFHSEPIPFLILLFLSVVIL